MFLFYLKSFSESCCSFSVTSLLSSFNSHSCCSFMTPITILNNFRRGTTSKWQNRSFLLSSPQRIPIFTIPPRSECLCGNLGVQHRSSSMLLEKKNLKLDSLKGIRTVLLYPHHPHPNAGGFSVERASLGPSFLPWRKMSVCEWVPCFPSCLQFCHEAPCFLTPSGILRRAMQLGSRSSWETSSKECASHSLLHRLHQGVGCQATGDAQPAQPSNSPRVPHHCMCLPPTQSSFIASSLCTSLGVGRASPAVELGESKFGHLALPKGNNRKAVSTPSWLCKIERRHVIMWSSSSHSSQEGTRCVE